MINMSRTRTYSCLDCVYCYPPTQVCNKHNKSVARGSSVRPCKDFKLAAEIFRNITYNTQLTSEQKQTLIDEIVNCFVDSNG